MAHINNQPVKPPNFWSLDFQFARFRGPCARFQWYLEYGDSEDEDEADVPLPPVDGDEDEDEVPLPLLPVQPVPAPSVPRKARKPDKRIATRVTRCTPNRSKRRLNRF